MYQLNQIPSETQIQKNIRQAVFGTHMFCPVCQSRNVVRYGERYRCRKCRTKFSLLSHTWLSNMKLGLEIFWFVLWCWISQVPVKQTMALTKLSEKTVRLWFDRFRSHLPEEENTLGKIIQLDEAYFGGETGEHSFMGKEIGTRNLVYRTLPHPHPAREDAWEFLQRYVAPKSTICTDGAGIYRGIDSWWPVKHETDIHKKFQFEKTSEIEGIFGVLRTFIRRMYHHVTVDKLPYLVGEFCFRFCHPEIFEDPRSYLMSALKLVPTG